MPIQFITSKKLFCSALPTSVVRALTGFAQQEGWTIEALSENTLADPQSILPSEDGQKLPLLVSEHAAAQVSEERFMKIVLLSSESEAKNINFSLFLPIKPHEFTLLLRNLNQPTSIFGMGNLQVFRLDMIQKHLERAGEFIPVNLTDRELALLGFLMRHPEGIDRQSILRQVWGYRPGVETQTLETHISRLRGKVGTLGLNIQVNDGIYLLQVAIVANGNSA